MGTSTPDWSRKVNLLPRGVSSLAHWPLDAPPGTLFVLGTSGGISLAPDADFPLVFGRCEPDVHVCVGAEDEHVSRRQGYITRDGSGWVLDNVGRRPIRFATSQRLLIGGDRAELPGGYTPLFVLGPNKEHLLEVRVVGRTPRYDTDAKFEHETQDGDVWPLTALERFVLVCLAQRYLRGDPRPQPLTWDQVGAELAELRPQERWSGKRAAHVVAGVRKRLSPTVPGLVENEIPPPASHMINHNLVVALLSTTTLVRSDLSTLDENP